MLAIPTAGPIYVISREIATYSLPTLYAARLPARFSGTGSMICLLDSPSLRSLHFASSQTTHAAWPD